MKQRISAVWLALFASLFLAACSAQQQPAPVKPVDPGLESGWRLARFALQSGRYSQAVSLYEQALARAYARDDAAAIGDIGYEYALALLRDGKPDLAAKQAVRTRMELDRRDASPFAELFLVEAVARYTDGETDAARTAANEAIRRARPDDQETRGRAHFILGMLAADAKDIAAVERALAAMRTPENASLKADKAELEGRRLMLRGEAATAVPAFEASATLRRNLRNYAGMARALASAAVAAESAGDSAVAADLYYRAGLSATAQENTANAKTWLNKALELAARNGLGAIAADARDRLRSLNE